MALMPDFDTAIERRGSDSYKWDDNERLFGRPDLLPFWVADMDFATPAPILDAIRTRVEHPFLGYGIRSERYFAAVEDWLRRRHDWRVERQWLKFCPPSSIVGIQGVVSALTDPGESIVVPSPTYGPLLKIAASNGRRLIRCPLAEQDGHFELDVQRIEESVEKDTRVVILCSPHNPTGRVWRREELQALAELAERHDLTVISDEVHADLVMPGHRHIPFGSVGGKRSVTVVSPNKTFNTAGIPQATLIMPDEKLRNDFQAWLDCMQLNHDSTFGAEGMIAGYTQCEGWLEALIPYLADNHRFAEEYLANKVPGVHKTRAEATYLGWLDFREMGLEQSEIMRRLVSTGGVGLYGGTDFGEEGRGFFRMNIACPRARLEQGLAAIAKSVRQGAG